MSFVPGTDESEKAILERAEEIYAAFRDELWEIDRNKAMMTPIKISVQVYEKGKQKVGEFETNLLDLFSREFSDYETNRFKFGQVYHAEELVRTFNMVKDCQAYNKSESFWRKFRAFEDENMKLKAHIETLTKEKDKEIGDLVRERDRFKRMYEECDTNRSVGNTEYGSVE